MAYTHIQKAFGPQNGGVGVTITNAATGAPVTLYADASGTVISTLGQTYLTPSGNLDLYVTSGPALHLEMVSGSPTTSTMKYSVLDGKISAAGVVLVPPGNVPVSYNLSSGQLQKPDGASVLPAAPAAVTVYDEEVLLSSAFSSLKFTGPGVVASYVSGQVTVTVPGAAGVTLETMPDITTANLPSLNTPLNLALAAKFGISSDHTISLAAGAQVGLSFRKIAVSAGVPFVKAAVTTLGSTITLFPAVSQTLTLEISTNNGGSYSQSFVASSTSVYQLSPSDNYVRISGTGTFDWT